MRMIPSILHDDLAFTSDISPRSSASRAKFYWGIDQSVRYGDSTPILAKTAGIVDTGKKISLEFSAFQPSSTWKFLGTTLIYFASDAFASYQQATGAVLDNDTGFLRLTRSQFRNLKSLFFTIHGVSPLSFSPGE